MRTATGAALLVTLVALSGCLVASPTASPDPGTGAPATPSPTAGAGTASPGPSGESPTTSTATPGPGSENGTTDTDARDPDGDGFTDCQERRLLDDADPDRMDVYVEVDWTNGSRPDPAELRRVVGMFASAPVENPGGERGIRLHLVYDERLPRASDGAVGLGELRSVIDRYRDDHADYAGRGYHYALFVDEVEGRAAGTGGDGWLVVQRSRADWYDPNLTTPFYVKGFAHELGHSLGLTRAVFEGIDSPDYSYDEYPSIMNYAATNRDGSLDYSDGTSSEDDFDDWGYIEENGTVPDRSALRSDPACPPSVRPPGPAANGPTDRALGRSSVPERIP